MNMKTYYQPIYYYDDGTNIEWGNMPEELASFMAFETREDCEAWLKDNGYDPGDYNISEYHDDDIEEVVLIDADGNYIDGTGSVGCYNLEKDLDEGYDMLQDTIKRAMEKTGKKRLSLGDNCCTLYEDYGTLGGIVPYEFEGERPEIVSIDLVSAYDTDSEIIPLENITDYDDYVMLNDAICQEYGV